MQILTINSGSSSLKFSIYRMESEENLLRTGELSRIGMPEGDFEIRDGNGRKLLDKSFEIKNHDSAIQMLFNWMQEDNPDRNLNGIGHRLVHGGKEFREPLRLEERHIHQLEALTPLAPEHLPHEIKAIKVIFNKFPDISQVACFDTGFHRHMPKISQMYPLSAELWDSDIRRYGFHGLSYEYIMQELEKELGDSVKKQKIIIAHLGNGASMAAVKEGKSIDTTMGFTPAGGLMMGTRSGDLDPGVLVYLEKEKNYSVSDINRLVNEQAGLIGVSGKSSSMKDLLDKEETDTHSREAIELFCYQALKYLGAMTAVLGGLDILVFTGGIGENSPEIRERISQKADFLAIDINSKKNSSNEAVISSDESPVNVRVIKTDEELMIARHSFRVLQSEVRKESGETQRGNNSEKWINDKNGGNER